MCGISGIVYFNEQEPSIIQLKRMTGQMIHRGPDDEGVYIDNKVGLGFRRLSIIDLAEGSQPLSNEDDTVWIVFNGEIYNYKSLRSQLEQQGHIFKTRSDTEVIVHLYEQYGEDCVQYLRGMFAFMIWDKRKQKLFGARDHFGIKPMYYYKDHSKFLFASEMKSIMAGTDIRKQISVESLFSYLSFQFVPEPSTLFQHVNKLPPAHTVSISMNGEMEIRKYWDPIFEPVERSMSDYIEEIRAKMKDSVAHHMHSDVELGSFLSSGIDSTAITAHMLNEKRIKTFSVGFEGPQNETEIAGQTAKTLGSQHYSKIISEEEYFRSVPYAVWNQDEPVADPAAIALYHVAELASNHVKVVLSGKGADELFGGYRIYKEPHSLRPLSWMPKHMMRMANRLASLLPNTVKGRNYLLRGTTPLEERYIGNAKIFTEDMKQELFRASRHVLQNLPTAADVTSPYYEKSKHLDSVSRMQYIDMNVWLQGDILAKADKMTMAHSLELRVPFLDRELFEAVRKIPASYRLANGTTKYIFRKAMEGIVPEPIVNRPKLGFPVPIRQWIKGSRGDEMMDQIEYSGIHWYFNIHEIKSMLMKHRKGQGDYSRQLWSLYILSIWYTINIQEVSYKELAI